MFSINTTENIKNIVKQHPIIFTLVTGILLRVILIPTALTYDLDFWATVIKNLKTGTGLYCLPGYYYTPVWGYVLAIISAIQSTFLDIGELGVRSFKALTVEAVKRIYMSATVPSIAFSYSLKIPLMIVDLGLAYLVRVLILDITKDKKKANTGFALMFLCLSCIAVSMCIAMPDGISALFLVLTIILVRRDQSLLAGMCYSISVLTKFFPVFLFFIIFAYLLMKSKSNTSVNREYLYFIAGGIIMSGVIFLPQILHGELIHCFQFLTDRSGLSSEKSFLESLIGCTRIVSYSLIVLFSMWMAYGICKKSTENLFDEFMRRSFVILGLCFLYPSPAQYLVVMVPFVVYHIVVESKKFMKCWLLIGIGGFLMTYSSLTATLLPLGVYIDFPSLDWIIHVFNMITTGPVSIFMIMFSISAIIQYVGVVLALWIIYNRHYREHKKDSNKHLFKFSKMTKGCLRSHDKSIS